MDTNKMLWGTLAGGVTNFLLGWAIWGIALDAFFTKNAGTAQGVSKEMPDMLWLIIGSMALGALYTYIFNRWAGIKTFKGGATAGAVIAGLSGLANDSIMYATTNIMTLPGLGVDVLATIVSGALMGGVIGWVLGRNNEG